MIPFRYKRAVISLIVVLLAFLVCGTLLISWQQRNMFRTETERSTANELDLMGDAFYESLLKSDFTTIRTFIDLWGKAHPEFVQIKVTAPNGFVVGHYERPAPSGHLTFGMQKTIEFDGRVLLTIEIVVDQSRTDAIVAMFRNRLLTASLLFTCVLGVVLWWSQRSMALAPLEQEIERRERAEADLRRAHDGLEQRVQERTMELQLELSERLKAKAALQKREEHIRMLLNSTAEGIYGIDTSGNCTFFNASGLRMLGYRSESELIGRNIHALIHHRRPDGSPYPETDCRIYSAYRSLRGSHDDTEVFWRSDGTSFPVEYWSFPVVENGDVAGAVVTFIDITDRQKLEAQLIQSQKMEAIGTLAGGVAHDFNNILTAIIGYGSILLRKMPDSDPLKPNVTHILDSAHRATRLTRSLLTFGRKQVIAPQPVDLNSIVRRIEKLLLPLIGEDIDLRTELSDDDLVVHADAGQIEQVLMNLATNARDAMPSGGCFTIRTEWSSVDTSEARIHGMTGAGTFAVMSVSDTGTGMNDQTRSKIFEPFFTTKEVGKGTGLGLAIAYGIVQQHAGTITVYSEVGKGTTFRIYLPLIRNAAIVNESEDAASAPASGSETILVAEDDRTVLALVRSVLEEHGYQVLEAGDGEEAVRVFRENQTRVHLVIMDTIMPKKNGKEAYDLIRSLQPDVRVLFMSGYTADVISRQGLLQAGFDLLQKPLAPAELLARVRKALAS